MYLTHRGANIPDLEGRCTTGLFVSCIDVSYIRNIPACYKKSSCLTLGQLGKRVHVIIRQSGTLSPTTSRDPGAMKRLLIGEGGACSGVVARIPA